MSRARDLARFANNQALSVSSDLNVGINSTSPDGKLDVIGDVDVSGIVTASSFSGDGSQLTGVSGFATALSATQTDPLFHVFKTPRNLTVSAGSSLFIESDLSSGNIALTKMGQNV